MQFLNPAVLAGLFAALIPLAIHLLHRGETRPVPFSNIRLLRTLQNDRMQKVRMRQWLLLLLRMLAIALIVCAFARPTYQSGTSWGGRVVPAAAAVLVDQSYSMSYRLPSGTITDRQRTRVSRLSDVFSKRDRVALIPFASTQREALNVSPEELSQRLTESVTSQEGTDLVGALRQAVAHFEQHPDLDRELYIFTDGARHNWSETPSMSDWIGDARVYLDVPEEAALSNAYIEEVRFSPWLASARGEMVLSVDVRYIGPAPLQNHTVDLFVDGERVGRKSLNLEPQGKTQVELRFTPRASGHMDGFVELAEDALPLDNRRYFSFYAPPSINALVLGTQPASTYYVRRALNAATLSDPVLNTQSGRLDELDANIVREVDVLILCDLERLDRTQTQIVHDFVSNGGGLIVFPSVRADVKYLNRDFLPGIMPVRIRDITGRAEDQTQFRTLDDAAEKHPLFADLMGQEVTDAAHFFAHFSLEAERPIESLVYFDDGQIALASAWRGSGRSALSSFPLDLAWSDLPLRGLFPPMIHRLVREFSQPVDRFTAYTVGDKAHRYLEKISLEAPITAESPNGQRLRLQPARTDERYAWSVPSLNEAGVWKIKDGERIVDRFPVNVDARESDIRRIGRAEIIRALGNDVQFLTDSEGMRIQILGSRYGRELWRECLALALVLLTIELWLGRAPRGAVPAAKSA